MNLQGNDALNKANKLMESMATSQKVDSFSNVESTHIGYDGKTYGVVKENTMYVLKVSNKTNALIAEDFDYINGVQNKQRFSKKGYTEIMKHFNLMNIEMKRLHGTDLMTEAVKQKELLDEKKSVLKVKKKSSSEEISPAQMDAPIDDGLDDLGSEEFGAEEDLGGEEDLEGFDDSEGSENPDDYSDVDPDDLGTDDPEKMIQKLSGKLAFELRDFGDEEKYSDTAKFAMSMITAALDVDKMSDEDKNAIESKVSNTLDVEGAIDGGDEGGLDDEGLGSEEPIEDLGSEEELETEQVFFEMEEPLEETKSALDNIHVKVGSFAVDEPVVESMRLSKGKFAKLLGENKKPIVEMDEPIMFEMDNEQDMSDVDDEKILFDETPEMSIEEDDDSSEQMYDSTQPRELDRTKDRLDIAYWKTKDNKDLALDFDWFQKHVQQDPNFQHTPEGHPQYAEYYKEKSGEAPFIANDGEEYVEVWGVYPLNSNMGGQMEEDAYSEKPKAPKHNPYPRQIGDLKVGGIVGDDDAVGYTLEADDVLTDTDVDDFPEDLEFGKVYEPKKKEMKRNPFIYQK